MVSTVFRLSHQAADVTYSLNGRNASDDVNIELNGLPYGLANHGGNFVPLYRTFA